MPEETVTSPITFSESFQLVDKQGVAHTFTFGGTVGQKNEIIKTCAQSIKTALGGGWKTLAQAPSQAGASDPNTTTEIIMAEQLIVSADEKGIHFKIKGGRYKQHGVSVYEEYLEALGISPDMKPGAYEFRKRVVIQCNKNGEKTSCKVIALA
ncbi:MAG TPA: hypothetical protein VF723_11415 [Pyrinomonadaceae bacterium]|jgi:hypothetical protein